MGYRTFVSMNIALIGTGKIAETYAKRYAQAGHLVLMAWKNDDRTGVSPELATYENIHFCSIEEAAALADLIIIATAPIHVREVAYWLGDVRRKVIIDATANIQTNVEEDITTLCAVNAITGSPHVIKVFSTRGYEKLLKPLFKHDRIQLVMVGDSIKAKEVAKILTIDLGTQRFFDIGGNEAIPLFNELTKGWRKLAQDQEQNQSQSVSAANYQNLKL